MRVQTKTSSSSWLLAGLGPILLGLLLYVVGRPLDGFVGGLFQGSSVVLVLVGVFVVGQATWRVRTGDDREGDDGGWWLPSREAAGDTARRGSDDG